MLRISNPTYQYALLVSSLPVSLVLLSYCGTIAVTRHDKFKVNIDVYNSHPRILVQMYRTTATTTTVWNNI